MTSSTGRTPAHTPCASCSSVWRDPSGSRTATSSARGRSVRTVTAPSWGCAPRTSWGTGWAPPPSSARSWWSTGRNAGRGAGADASGVLPSGVEEGRGAVVRGRSVMTPVCRADDLRQTVNLDSPKRLSCVTERARGMTVPKCSLSVGEWRGRARVVASVGKGHNGTVATGAMTVGSGIGASASSGDDTPRAPFRRCRRGRRGSRPGPRSHWTPAGAPGTRRREEKWMTEWLTRRTVQGDTSVTTLAVLVAVVGAGSKWW